MPNRYNLELDGRPAGALFDFTHALPVQRGPGSAETAYASTDMIHDCGAGMSREFYEWVTTAFSRTTQRKNGAVLYRSPFVYPSPSRSPSAAGAGRVEFVSALVTEVILPELDKSLSGKQAAMIVKLSPENTGFTKLGTSGKAAARVKHFETLGMRIY